MLLINNTFDRKGVNEMGRNYRTALSIADGQKIETGRQRCLRAVEDMDGSISSTQLRLLVTAIDVIGCTSVYKCLV